MAYFERFVYQLARGIAAKNYICIYRNSEKLQKLAKYRECEKVNEWIKSITNHLYWFAASLPEGDGNEMEVLDGTHL